MVNRASKTLLFALVISVIVSAVITISCNVQRTGTVTQPSTTPPSTTPEPEANNSETERQADQIAKMVKTEMAHEDVKSANQTALEPTPALVVTPDPFARVDGLLRQLPLASIAFNTPETINLNATSPIQLVMGLDALDDELQAMVTARGSKETERIHVSNIMEASLTGSNFTITPLTPQRQAISRAEPTRWSWDVKPTAEGPQALHLTLTAFLTMEGAATPRTIRTFDKSISINVTVAQRLSAFVEKNWQWLWAVILAPIGGWIWKKQRADPAVEEKAVGKSAGGNA